MYEPKLLTIKEFSNFARVPQSTLRFYDEIELLTPILRGDENNYRYYSPQQLKALNFIEVLIDLGIPLATIKDMVKERTPESMIDLLNRQETILDRKLNELRLAYSIIHAFRTNIQTGLLGPGDDVREESLDELHFVLGQENDFKRNVDEDAMFRQFCDMASEYRINLRYPIGRYHNDMESFIDKPNWPDKYFSLDPIGNCVRSAGKFLVGYRRGYEGDFGDLPQKMAEYADYHHLLFKGPVFIVYLLNEICLKDPSQYLACISVNVSKKRFMPSAKSAKEQENEDQPDRNARFIIGP
ncbi:MAG: MerR family transcriptional regulator [Peptococcaceae bacterium]|jgi:DNA-binding transcriptional MerR regulator|nr:MerR family transcriptional regulator [Peptococcaceae bacterium]